MVGELLLLFVGVAIGLGGPALFVWWWMRHGQRAQPVSTARIQPAPVTVQIVAIESAPASRSKTIDPAQEAAKLIPSGPWVHQERGGVPEDPDLAVVASVAEPVAPAPTFDAPTEMAEDPHMPGSGPPVAPPQAERTEPVPLALDTADPGTTVVPRDDIALPVRLASASDAEAYTGPDVSRAEEQSQPVTGLAEVAPAEPAHEIVADRPSQEAQHQKSASPGECLVVEECSGEPAESLAATPSGAVGTKRASAEDAPLTTESTVAAVRPAHAEELAAASMDACVDFVPEDPAIEIAHPDEPDPPIPRPSKLAQHRDRRGQRRALPRQPEPAAERPPAMEDVSRTPAEGRLRLMLHPIRRTATLFAMLARPTGYPSRIALLLGERTEVSAYNEDRYDDVDLEWSAGLLVGEIRLACEEGYQWLRSARRIHIFSETPDEPGLISVGSATLISPSTIICRQEDADAVRAAAKACGSPAPVAHDHWTGIPNGWTVLSGYRPAHAASDGLESGLTGLDPGVGAEIRLLGGLRVRSASFAEGRPPRIEIVPFPAGAKVSIDGKPAELREDGAWRADGWDRPGDHLVDVVPGPSATYRILEDPWPNGGWERWDAHAQRFPTFPEAPWARAQICGAGVSGPTGEHVIAADAMASVLCLGLRRGVAVLQGRPDAPVAVGLLGEPPAFLISASGPRRHQGWIAWLSPSAPSVGSRMIDPQWVAAVRSAASRRLPVEGGGGFGEDGWRRARERARRYRKRRS